MNAGWGPRRAFAAALVIVAAGCQTVDVGTPQPALIGDDVFLRLPSTPAYPRRETLLQTVVGDYRGERRLFQSVVSLSPDLVRVVITAPAGPRVLTATWSADGIAVERTPLAPRDLEAASILADLMLVYWDLEAVDAALAGAASVVERDGVRTVVREGRKVVTVERRTGGAAREQAVLVNHDLGYVLRIQTVRAGEK